MAEAFCLETFRNFLSFDFPGVPWAVRLPCDVPRHNYSLSLSSPYPLIFMELVENYLVLTILLSGQTWVRSANSSGTTVGAHPGISTCVHTHIHTEDEHTSFIFLGNLAKQMEAKRWSRETDLVVRQVWLVGWLVGFEWTVLGHFVLLAFGQQDIFDTYNFIHFFLLLHSYQISDFSCFNSSFPVKLSIYKCNNSSCFIQTMSLINCNLHLSVCQL